MVQAAQVARVDQAEQTVRLAQVVRVVLQEQAVRLAQAVMKVTSQLGNILQILIQLKILHLDISD
jgi:hypothetical protein